MRTILAQAIFLIFFALLAGCGGGGGAPPATPTMQENPPAIQPDPLDDSSPSCGVNEMPDEQNCVCDSGYERDGGNVCVLSSPSCGVNEIADGQNCVCDSGYEREQGVCILSSSPMIPPMIISFDTPEFRQSGVFGKGISALYAYERGYFGQGVTVLILERSSRITHIDLAPNYLSISTTSTVFVNAPSVTDSSHGTGVAGFIAAARNGKGSHGVAPKSKFYVVDFDKTQTNTVTVAVEYRSFLMENAIKIDSASYTDGRIIGVVSKPLASLTLLPLVQRDAERQADRYVGLDVVHVIAAGNDALNSVVIQPAVDGAYPWVRRDLEPHWMIVVALNDEQDAIAEFSNACGYAKMWCLAAPGTSVRGPSNASDTAHNLDYSGTSFATPVVSGALAVLQSAAPELPMTVIRPILLESATPMGSRITTGMPDELYGWGAVNISAGIVSIEAMTTADGKLLLSDLRRGLPAEFAHLHGRLNNVSVALKITDNSYHNIALSDIVGGDGDLPQAIMGGAAKELLADGFNAGESFRFWGGLNYADSGSRFIGESGGLFGAAASSDTAGYLRWTTADYEGFSLFGEYEYTDINADYGGNSLVSAIDDARADGWTAGLQFGDIWQFGDKIRLSARQESHISGGEMILHYPVADGDFHSAFIGETQQTIRTQETRIPLKQKASTIWTAGYSQEYKGGKWAAAMEYNAATNKSGFSAMMEFELR